MNVNVHNILNLLAAHLNRYRIETLLDIGAVGAALVFPRVGSRWFRTVEQQCSKLAQRRRLAVLAVGLLALALRAAVLPIRPIPLPEGPDEFSYLLAADTFAHGRVTNPTHPMWAHFEVCHILQKPTYMSKYFPAQGLLLAAGQVAAGNPFWGVWFSMGLACAAICWMLQGWMPPGWALLGGALAAMRLATFSYWGNSYWGGAAAAIGGALVLGAVRRLRRSLQARDALALGVGIVILANSRPYEGFFLGLGVAIAFAAWLWGKKQPPLGMIVKRAVAPLLLLLIPAGYAMGYYFWRVTGSPFRTPYFAYEAAHNPVPNFPWQPMKALPESYPNGMEPLCLVWSLRHYQFAREHPVILAWEKARDLANFFLGPLLMMPVVVLLLAQCKKFFAGLRGPGKTRLLLLLCALPLVAMALPTYFFPHYAAPLTGALYALAIQSMRQLRLWQWRGQPVGLQLTRAVPVLAVVVLVLQAGLLVLQNGFPISTQDLERSSILAQLNGQSGGQLVIVRCVSDYEAGEPWVYNHADIDAAKAVWAWDMGASANEELIRYFKDRRAWLLETGESPPKLVPYIPGEGIGTPPACAKH